MVTRRDYKMISIFEVFAVNRSEDDFLENLFIFKDLVNEEQALEDRMARDLEIIREEEEAFPHMKVLNQFRERLSPDEYAWSRAVLTKVVDSALPFKNLTQAITCWGLMKDDADLVHSVKRIFQRNQ